MQIKNTVKVAKIELPIADGTSKHIPKNSVEFIDHDGIMQKMAIGYRDNMPVLLIGETGTGKTSAVRNLCELTQNGFRRVNLNGGTTADELVGKILLNEKGTIWVDGILTEAMRNGETILFDEINAALPEVLFVLQSVLDDDGYLVLTEKDDKEIVHKHPNFRFFASCNPPSYAGTKELNRALLSRFPICIDASYPSARVEKEIIKKHLGKVVADLEITDAVMLLAEDTRKAYQEGKSDFAIGTRDILNFLRLSKYLNPKQAIEASFIGKLNTEDQAGLRAMVRIHLPTDTKTEIKLEHITALDKQFLIGGTYVINADVHNVYGSIKKKTKSAIENLERIDIGTAYKTNTTHAAKGDTFKLLGLYRENEAGISKSTSNDKIIGALLEFKTGQNKGSIGVLRTDTQPLIDALYAQL